MPCRTAFAQILDALDGIAYLVDGNGRFLDWGRPHWNSFAQTNGASQLAQAARFDLGGACSDSETANAYLAILDAIWSGRRARHVFRYRCDSPNVRREFRMAVSRVDLDGRPLAVLFHSQSICETERPPMDIFASEAIRLASADSPLIRMCSYCHRIHRGRDESWIEPETYYRDGGSSSVRISHGICPSCVTHIVEPIHPARAPGQPSSSHSP